MTIQEFAKALKALGFKAAHKEFKTATPLPYLVYDTPREESLYADGKKVLTLLSIRLKLYEPRKNLAHEEKIENFIKSLDVIYVKEEDIAAAQNIYAVSYEFDIYIDNDKKETD